MSRIEAAEVRKLAVDFVAKEGRTISGLAVPYNVTADTGMWFTERFMPGVFTKSIGEAARALPLLREHEWDSLPLGKAIKWEETSDALYGHWELDSRADAREAYRLVEDGYLRGLSVGFLPIRSEWVEPADSAQREHVDRLEARLVETSLCNVPVFEGAQVLATRSLGRVGRRPTPELDAARAWLAGYGAR